MPIPIPISTLPSVGPTGYTNDDLLVIVNYYDSPFTGVTKNTHLTEVRDYILSGLSFSFTGGTVSGATNFTGGLTANTISATTIGCVTDFYVTNVHGCSPITIWDEVQSNGSSSSGTLSLAFGDGVTSSGDYSHAEGGNTLSIGYGSHSEGSGTTSIGYYSHSEGYDNISGFKAFSGISANTIVDGVIILTGGTDYTSEFTSSDKVVYVDQFNYLHIESYNSISYSSPNFQINLTNTSINGEAYYVVDINNLNSVSATTYFGEFTHSEGGNRKSGGNLSLGEGSHSEGSDNISIGQVSHSEGIGTISVGEGSHSEGRLTTSTGSYSHSEGKGTQSIGSYSHSEGSETISIGQNSHSEGYNTRSGWKGFTMTCTNGLISLSSEYGDATSEFGGLGSQVIFGNGNIYTVSGVTYDSGLGQTLIQLYDNVTSSSSVSDIENLFSEFANITNGTYTHSEGHNTIAVGFGSHSEGGAENITNAVMSLGRFSHSEGQRTKSFGVASHSEGTETQSISDYSHSEGKLTIAVSDGSHSEGRITYSGWKAFEIKTITNGVITINLDIDLTSEFGGGGNEVILRDGSVNQIYEISGTSFSSPDFIITLYNTGLTTGNYVAPLDNLNSIYATYVFGEYSHSEGEENKSIGYSSHAEGYNTKSAGDYSHSEGDSTISYGNHSHSEGYLTTSVSDGSHAEGRETISNGEYSHTEGYGTISNGDYQHVIGKFNLTGETDEGTFIIGNGTNGTNRSNLLVAKNSEVTITGQLGIGTSSINASSALQIDSTTQGFLPPRMSATDAESITAVEGLIVYITGGTGAYITSKGWWGYTGNTSTDWAKIGP
jgi:hypothetical protein